MSRKLSRSTARRFHDIIHHHHHVTPDWRYWIEHVVHWHAALVAIIAVLAVGYIFFSQQATWASGY